MGQIESGKGSIGKLLVDETLYNHILAIVDAVQQLANALNSDKGTIGKLIYDPELYNQVRGSLTRVDSMLQDLQPGKGTAGQVAEGSGALQRNAEDHRRDPTRLSPI